MVVGPGKSGRGPVKLFWKLLFSLLAVLGMFEGMVTAFHLLNLPSNLAVFAGLCLLLLLAAGGVVLFRVLWRRQSKSKGLRRQV